MLSPGSELELSQAVAQADGPLCIQGGGTRDIGAVCAGTPLVTTGISGITLYEPGALTLVAKAGTPLAEIEAALDAENQRLAFEPPDMRVLLGTQGTPTLGGVVASNASGPRRALVGACRDHLLGVRFVDGTGRVLSNGGRVMKNVTGYDLVKLMAGSWGTLGVLSEVSLKVLPRPSGVLTLRAEIPDLAQAQAALIRATASPFEVSGAAWVNGVAYLRLEGFEVQLTHRQRALIQRMAGLGDWTPMAEDPWADLRDMRALADCSTVWKLSLRPSTAAELAAPLAREFDLRVALDHGAATVWLGMSSAPALAHEALRVAAKRFGGHCSVIKALPCLRASGTVFAQQSKAIREIEAGLRAKFDPRGILNPGRMG